MCAWPGRGERGGAGSGGEARRRPSSLGADLLLLLPQPHRGLRRRRRRRDLDALQALPLRRARGEGSEVPPSSPSCARGPRETDRLSAPLSRGWDSALSPRRGVRKQQVGKAGRLKSSALTPLVGMMVTWGGAGPACRTREREKFYLPLGPGAWPPLTFQHR